MGSTRRRRLVIAVMATATAFAMSLLMSWVNARLHNEPGKILAVLGAGAWVVDEGTSGPFTAPRSSPLTWLRRWGNSLA